MDGLTLNSATFRPKLTDRDLVNVISLTLGWQSQKGDYEKLSWPKSGARQKSVFLDSVRWQYPFGSFVQFAPDLSGPQQDNTGSYEQQDEDTPSSVIQSPPPLSLWYGRSRDAETDVL
jgi:hypothetical protein